MPLAFTQEDFLFHESNSVQNTLKENRKKEDPPAMTGNPAVNSKWEEHGKLLMYTSLGVRASHKVKVLNYLFFTLNFNSFQSRHLLKESSDLSAHYGVRLC